MVPSIEGFIEIVPNELWITLNEEGVHLCTVGCAIRLEEGDMEPLIRAFTQLKTGDYSSVVQNSL